MNQIKLRRTIITILTLIGVGLLVARYVNNSFEKPVLTKDEAASIAKEKLLWTESQLIDNTLIDGKTTQFDPTERESYFFEKVNKRHRYFYHIVYWNHSDPKGAIADLWIDSKDGKVILGKIHEPDLKTAREFSDLQ
ncbi:hypothetical protein [Paenibacillus chitinolyticus]|uniref:hypothetical protein n=1 Tax=Paenibacillus chitinolyticus TaxID=79263 RepID=UPI003CFDC232